MTDGWTLYGRLDVGRPSDDCCSAVHKTAKNATSIRTLMMSHVCMILSREAGSNLKYYN